MDLLTYGVEGGGLGDEVMLRFDLALVQAK